MANVFDPNDLKIVQELKNELRELKAIFTDLAKQVKTTQDSFSKQSSTLNDLKNKSQQLTEVDRELIKLDKQMERAEAQLTEEYKQVQKAVIAKKEAVKKSNEELKKQAGITKKSGGLFKSMTKSILAAGSAFLSLGAAIRIIKDISKVVIDFSKAQSNLAAILGKTRDEIRDLTEDAKKYGAITKFTATEVSDLQTELAKLGFTQTEIKNSTGAILDLAAATNADLAEAASVAGGTLRAFNLDASESERVASVLAVATTKSGLAFSDYGTILGTVGPIANKFGLEIEDTIAVLGKLRDAKFDASSAATAFRNILLKLSDPSSELTKRFGGVATTSEELFIRLKILKDEGIDLGEVLQLTDVRASAAFSTMIDSVDGIKDLKTAISGANDELKEMVATQLDNLSGDLQIARSAWEGFILSLEDGSGVLSTIARGAVQALTEELGNLTRLAKGLNAAQKEASEDIIKGYVDKIREQKNAEETLVVLLKFKEIQLREINKLEEEQETAGRRRNKQIEKEIKHRNNLLEASEGYIDSLNNEILATEEKTTKTVEKAKKEIEAEEKAKKAKWEAKLKEGELLRQADQERFKQKADIEESITEELARIDKEWADIRIDNEKTITEKLIEGEKLFTEAFNKQAEERAATEEKNAEKRKELNREIASAIISGASSLATELSNLNNIEYENEIGSLERKRDAEIENAEKTGRDITAINTKYDTLIKKKQYEQLQNQKKAAKFQAAISAATIILNALKTEPFVPLGLIMSGVAATIAGVQIAAINKQSVPKFGYGSDGKLQKDTFATIGDRYQHEAVIMPDGSLMFSDNKPQNVLLPANSQVLSGEQTREFIQDRGLDTALMKQMIIQQRETTKAVRKLSRITRTDSRIIEEGDNYRNSYIR